MAIINNKEYPFALFGIECSDGWLGIIQPILDYIEEYNIDKAEDYQIKILQIKEKWGGLRIYTNFETLELKQMIRDAESESYKTCEICGTNLNVGHTVGGWITTCCENCVKKMVSKRNVLYKWRPNEPKENNIRHIEFHPNGDVKPIYFEEKND